MKKEELTKQINDENNVLKNRYGNQFVLFEKDNLIYIYSNLLCKCFYNWENFKQYENGNEISLNINSVLMGFLFSCDESYPIFKNKYKKEFLESEYEDFDYFYFEEVLGMEENESTYTSWETKIESLMNSNNRKIFEINPIEKLSNEERNKILKVF